MKYIEIIILIFVFACFFEEAEAQPFESVFGKDTTQWNIVYQIPDYFPTLIFKAYGDTLVNGEKYVPVHKGYNYTPLELYGYMKEDTDVGKLWFRDIKGQEELLMDLSMEKSDSFYFGLSEPILYTVDTVYYNSGRKYISFNEANNAYPVLFIEGIGPFNMFFSNEVSDPWYAQIRCKKNDNILVFMNSDYDTCVDTLTSVNNYFGESIKIYPNPANGYLTISNNTTETGILELFNSLGTRVLSQKIIGDGQVDIGNLSNGVYLVDYQVKNKHFITKFTKQ